MINTKANSSDELGMLLAQIASLTKQADVIKNAMKDIGSKGWDTVFEGSLFESTYIESNRNVVDYKKLCVDHGINAATIEKYTSISAVFSIKTTAR